MKAVSPLLVTFFVISLLFVSPPANAYNVASGLWRGETVQYVDGRIAFCKARGVDDATVYALLESNNATVIYPIDSNGIGLAQLPVGSNTLNMAAQADGLAMFEWAQPDLIAHCYSNDTYSVVQWALKEESPGSNFEGMDVEVIHQYTHGSSAVKVGVIDTNVPSISNGTSTTIDHPDLLDYSRVRYHAFGGTGTADADHGLGIAGAIAAEIDNFTGIAGVAPNVGIEYFGVTDDQDEVPTSVIYEAAHDAMQLYDVDIINLSLGHTYEHDGILNELLEETRQMHVLLVCAAGDWAENNGYVAYPANEYGERVSWPQVISVGATIRDGSRAGYSPYYDSYWTYPVTMVAPGGADTDDLVGEIVTLESTGQSYGLMHGTSMSAAHVTGIAALMKSLNPNITTEDHDWQERLEGACIPLPGDDEREQETGYGMIDAELAILNALQDSPYAENGTINTSTTWSGTVFVNATVTVANGGVLTIQPGTKVVSAFDQQNDIYLVDVQEGGLVEVGSLTGSQTWFRKLDGASTAVGIHFSAGSGSPSFVHNTNFDGIEYGIGATGSAANPVEFTSTSIENCLFSCGLTGIYSNYADLIIDDCLHYGANDPYFMINLKNGDCTITDNSFESQGPSLSHAVYLESGEPSLTNCDFYIDDAEAVVIEMNNVTGNGYLQLNNVSINGYDYLHYIPGQPLEPLEYAYGILYTNSAPASTNLYMANCQVEGPNEGPNQLVELIGVVAGIIDCDFIGGATGLYIETTLANLQGNLFREIGSAGLEMFDNTGISMDQATNQFQYNGLLDAGNQYYSGPQIHSRDELSPIIEDGANNIFKAPENGTYTSTYCIKWDVNPAVVDVSGNYWGASNPVWSEVFSPYHANIQDENNNITQPAPFRPTLAMTGGGSPTAAELNDQAAQMIQGAVKELHSAVPLQEKLEAVRIAGMLASNYDGQMAELVELLESSHRQAETWQQRKATRKAVAQALMAAGKPGMAMDMLRLASDNESLHSLERVAAKNMLELYELGQMEVSSEQRSARLIDLLAERKQRLDQATAGLASFTDEDMINAALPLETELHAAYPNPFNPSTTIRFSLASTQQVDLEIYNSLGQRVRTLVSEHQQAGEHEVVFDAGDLTTGIYFCRLQTPEHVSVQKMMLLK